MFFPFGKRARRQRLAQWFPDASLALLRENVLFYRALPPAEQERLRDLTAVLVAEKNWEGCAGQLITDLVKVTIAGQAAVMLLGLKDYYFDEVTTILVYPGRFLYLPDDELGERQERQMLLGQACRDGPVILSWWHARWGGLRLASTNVVIHEMAHKLAELGEPDMSRPPLVDRALARRWDRVMGRALDRLREDSDRGRPTLLDPYGAESPAEFFAVASETFFLQGAALKRRHGDVYELLAACYQQDPATWSISAGVSDSARQAEEEYGRQAIAECTAALRRFPDFLEAYRERADHRLAAGDVAGALEDLAGVLRLVRGDDRADALHERAMILDEEGRTEEALADLDEAIGLCPDFSIALADRGAIRAERGDVDAALADLDEALRFDPDDDAALLERAALLSEAGQHGRALADLDRAARVCPQDPVILRRRARVHLDLGDLQKALADSTEALRLAPEDEESRRVHEEVAAAVREG
jgi:Mlc titration factor MtfA (ptsG expression regulator)/regulator of sirC expression with transglutaminase-like and TPR domain